MTATAQDILKRWRREGRDLRRVKGRPDPRTSTRREPRRPSETRTDSVQVPNVDNVPVVDLAAKLGRAREDIPERTRESLEAFFEVFPEAVVQDFTLEPVDLELAGWSDEARYVYHERAGVGLENGLDLEEAERLARIEVGKVDAPDTLTPLEDRAPCE